MTLTPFVYWAQSENNVFIKVDLRNVKDPTIKLEERKLQFESEGVGAQGKQNYGFFLDFYSEINSEACTCKVQDSKIDFNIVKNEKGWWPRLTSKPQKPAWLKIDFDRWQSEEDLNSEDEKVRDIREDYPDLYNRLQKEEFGYSKEDIKKVYLVLYNLIMFVGFTYIISVMAVRYLRDGVDCFPGMYEAIGTTVRYMHILQFSEVIMPIIGIKPGGFFIPLIQIGGRLLIITCLIDSEPQMQVQSFISYLYFVWSAAEIVRYPYYVIHVCKLEFGFLTWLRYSVWIILYPMGLVLEAIVLYTSIPYLERSGRFSYSLPNPYNFTFSLVTVVRVYLLLFFIPTAYMLIMHMYRERKKRLSPKYLKSS